MHAAIPLRWACLNSTLAFNIEDLSEQDANCSPEDQLRASLTMGSASERNRAWAAPVAHKHTTFTEFGLLNFLWQWLNTSKHIIYFFFWGGDWAGHQKAACYLDYLEVPKVIFSNENQIPRVSGEPTSLGWVSLTAMGFPRAVVFFTSWDGDPKWPMLRLTFCALRHDCPQATFRKVLGSVRDRP